MNEPAEKQVIPVAQYLRMSTDLQEGSIENQRNAIAEYAEANCLKVIATYSDPGESGLLLLNRPGLRQLLRDVADGPPFKAILVYDVSRFGRFQNIDEAAHYEFLCKSAGVPVIYCAETFNSPSKPANAVLKSLKRYMAAEFSRELGERVLRAQRRLFDQGFVRGGPCPYGLRRVAIRGDGSSRKLLDVGERKSVPTDHVCWVFGPEQEVQTVRFIFDSIAHAGMRCSQVADELNRRGTPRPGGTEWNKNKVYKIVRNPQYAGCAVWQKSTIRLHGPRRAVPVPERVTRPNTAAIVDPVTFERAQRRLEERPRRWNRERTMSALEAFLSTHGAVTWKDLTACNSLPSQGVIQRDCGSLFQALRVLGRDVGGNLSRFRCFYQRREIIRTLLDTFPERIRLSTGPRLRRVPLMFDGQVPVTVLFLRRILRNSATRSWRFRKPLALEGGLYLCCFRERGSEKVDSMYLRRGFPSEGATYVVREGSAWFQSARCLQSLRQFCEVADAMCAEQIEAI